MKLVSFPSLQTVKVPVANRMIHSVNKSTVTQFFSKYLISFHSD